MERSLDMEPDAVRITTEEVRHIAALARVGMTEDDIERMRDQMSNILEQFDALSQVDTEGVEPTSHSAEVRTVMRDDRIEPSADRESILSNAPHRQDDLIRVRAVLE